MVDTDKVYLMTKAAIFEKKEKKEAMKIVSYRRQDYILYHILLVLLSVTVAYAIIVGTVLFLVLMANETFVLNVGGMVALAAGLLVIYAVVLIFYYTLSHQYYGSRHVKARQKIREYLSILHALEDLENGNSEEES